MDKLLEKYSLKEIEEKTKISPVVLQKLFSYEFDSISEIKYKGFLKILKNEYKEFDFSKLEEKANEFYHKKTTSQPQVQSPKSKEEKDSKKFKIYIIIIVLVVLIGGFIYFMINKKEQKSTPNNNFVEMNMSIKEDNFTKENKTNIDVVDINATDANITDTNITSTTTIENNKEENKTLVILPMQKLWLRVTYLDNFKSKEYLTSHPIELNGSRDLFIKLGHGMETFIYKDNNLTPNTKKIVRIILKDGNLTITKKRISEFK